jgi:acyl-CoA reductase-like NAD-dependent aldehyde dehydrogenase
VAAPGKQLLPRAAWPALARAVRDILPEAFASDGHVLNLVGGEWGYPGHGKLFLSPVDGTPLAHIPMIDVETAKRAAAFAALEYRDWSRLDLDERRRRTAATLEDLTRHRDLLALLLVWEIGKPHRQALTSVDRCIGGVEWYVEHVEQMLQGRRPLGVISNVASWNYPLSVLAHAALTQMLAGNTVIAKTPTDGGLYALTLAFGLARRHGLPISLVSGSGSRLSEALVRGPHVAGLSFVGGKTSGREVAASCADRGQRYMLEMEGINSYGVWAFSDWAALGAQLRKGFEYGKQRCTAYTRFVVQRQLFPRFLDTYLRTVETLRVGHPLLVDSPDDDPPDVDFGPLINSATADSLREWYDEALGLGAVAIYEGELVEGLFLPDQDISAYARPKAIMNVPRNCHLYHMEPFGPLDSIVIVDRLEELVAEMNVSNGALVASIATDDPEIAARVVREARAFKVGVNRVRSRGDREEPFGGYGESWKGCFVGGRYLVQAVTEGPSGERLYGNFPDYTLLPEER